MTLLSSTSALAQPFLGYRQSNYSGVSGGDFNPANIADNRFVIKLSDEIINSMVLTKPLKSELDLSDSIYDLNTYNGILPDGIIN